MVRKTFQNNFKSCDPTGGNTVPYLNHLICERLALISTGFFLVRTLLVAPFLVCNKYLRTLSLWSGSLKIQYVKFDIDVP